MKGKLWRPHLKQTYTHRQRQPEPIDNFRFLLQDEQLLSIFPSISAVPLVFVVAKASG